MEQRIIAMYMDGYNQIEIAAKLHIAQKTLDDKLQKCRKSLEWNIKIYKLLGE